MKIYDKKLFKEGAFWLTVISIILVLVIITGSFDLKRHSAFLFNIVWMYYLNIKTIIISLSDEKSKKENNARQLAKIARKKVFGQKEPFIHILWVGLLIGSMTAGFYNLKIGLVMFLGGFGILIWYTIMINEEIACKKNSGESLE